MKKLLLALPFLFLAAGGASADGPCSIDDPDCQTFECELTVVGFWAAQGDPGCSYSGLIYRDCVGHLSYIVTNISCPG